MGLRGLSSEEIRLAKDLAIGDEEKLTLPSKDGYFLRALAPGKRLVSGFRALFYEGGLIIFLIPFFRLYPRRQLLRSLPDRMKNTKDGVWKEKYLLPPNMIRRGLTSKTSAPSRALARQWYTHFE
jgi:hypothetical protein